MALTPTSAWSAEALAQRVEHRRDLLAPELAGGLERDLAVAHHEDRRLARLAGHDERVEARVAQVNGDAAARVRVRPRAGERRLADDLDAAGERRAHARQQPRDDREARLRRERVGAGGKVLPHEVRAETVAAEEVPIDGLVDLLDARALGGEVDDQDLTVRSEPGGGPCRRCGCHGAELISKEGFVEMPKAP